MTHVPTPQQMRRLSKHYAWRKARKVSGMAAFERSCPLIKFDGTYRKAYKLSWTTWYLKWRLFAQRTQFLATEGYHLIANLTTEGH